MESFNSVRVEMDINVSKVQKCLRVPVTGFIYISSFLSVEELNYAIAWCVRMNRVGSKMQYNHG